LVVVQSLMEAYHCSLEQAMHLTLPQLIMLNHAAHIAYINSEKRADARHKEGGTPDATPGPSWRDDPVVGNNGERLSEIQKDDTKLFNYLRDWKGMG